MADFLLEIYWMIPLNLDSNYTRVRIYRSTSEDTGYELIDTIDLFNNGVPVTRYVDSTKKLVEKDGLFYIVRFYDPVNDTESQYYLTTYPLTPKEQRLVNEIKRWVGPYVLKDLVDTDLVIGVKYAIQFFNMIPPATGYTFYTFPPSHEGLLIYGATIYALLSKYLGVALKDFSYSDSGLSLNVDRGAKIKDAVDKINSIYNDLVHVSKLDLMYGPTGVGTVQLPISLGGRIGNITAIFDIFNAVGR